CRFTPDCSAAPHTSTTSTTSLTTRIGPTITFPCGSTAPQAGPVSASPAPCPACPTSTPRSARSTRPTSPHTWTCSSPPTPAPTSPNPTASSTSSTSPPTSTPSTPGARDRAYTGPAASHYHAAVRTLILQIAPVLRLARVSTAFGAVAGLWLTTLWSRAMPLERTTPQLEQTPLWLLLTGGALAGAGLYGFGAGLNDLLDAHRDRILRPNRPIVGGALPPEAAVSVVAGSLVVSVLGATVFGTPAVLATVFLATAVLVFNALGKFVPGIGMLLLSVIYAGHTLVPNLGLSFLPPVWWVMTHAMVIAGLSHS